MKAKDRARRIETVAKDLATVTDYRARQSRDPELVRVMFHKGPEMHGAATLELPMTLAFAGHSPDELHRVRLIREAFEYLTEWLTRYELAAEVDLANAVAAKAEDREQ